MAKPFIVDIPHELGRDEARRRIETGMDRGVGFLTKSGISVDQMAWTGDRLNFAVSAMAQKIDGSIDIEADRVRLEVRLPMLLALFADKVRRVVNREGTLLLTKK